MKYLILAFVFALTACGGAGSASSPTVVKVQAALPPNEPAKDIMGSFVPGQDIQSFVSNLEFKDKYNIFVNGSGSTYELLTSGYDDEVIAVGVTTPAESSVYMRPKGKVGSSNKYTFSTPVATSNVSATVYVFGRRTGSNASPVVVEVKKLKDSSNDVTLLDTGFTPGKALSNPAVLLTTSRVSWFVPSTNPTRAIYRNDVFSVAANSFTKVDHSQVSFVDGTGLLQDSNFFTQPTGGYAVLLDVTGF